MTRNGKKIIKNWKYCSLKNKMNVADIVDRQFNSTELELPDRYYARNASLKVPGIASLNDVRKMSQTRILNSNDGDSNMTHGDECEEICSDVESHHDDEFIEVNLPRKSSIMPDRNNSCNHSQRRQAIIKGNVNLV